MAEEEETPLASPERMWNLYNSAQYVFDKCVDKCAPYGRVMIVKGGSSCSGGWTAHPWSKEYILYFNNRATFPLRWIVDPKNGGHYRVGVDYVTLDETRKDFRYNEMLFDARQLSAEYDDATSSSSFSRFIVDFATIIQHNEDVIRSRFWYAPNYIFSAGASFRGTDGIHYGVHFGTDKSVIVEHHDWNGPQHKRRTFYIEQFDSVEAMVANTRHLQPNAFHKTAYEKSSRALSNVRSAISNGFYLAAAIVAGGF